MSNKTLNGLERTLITTTADLVGALETMMMIRLFELRVEQLFNRGRIRGSVHLGIGQEAVAVGARCGTVPGDLVLPTYRGHAYALAWGLAPEAGLAEVLGKDSGCCRGRGGSKHFASMKLGVLPGNALVAAALPIACGTALAAQMDRRAQVSVVPFGDGASNQAAFHEAMNLAAVWRLPVIFLLENNLYSEMTPIRDMVNGIQLVGRADSYGMRSAQVDGMDVVAVAEVTAEAARHARAGEGPTLIEALTYRFCGHMPGDTEPYRTQAEVEEWRTRDPITLVREQLLAAGITANELDRIAPRARAQIDAAQAAAEEALEPDRESIRLGLSPWMEVDR